MKAKYQVSSLYYSFWTLSTKEELCWIKNTRTNIQEFFTGYLRFILKSKSMRVIFQKKAKKKKKMLKKGNIFGNLGKNVQDLKIF